MLTRRLLQDVGRMGGGVGPAAHSCTCCAGSPPHRREQRINFEKGDSWVERRASLANAVHLHTGGRPPPPPIPHQPEVAQSSAGGGGKDFFSAGWPEPSSPSSRSSLDRVQNGQCRRCRWWRGEEGKVCNAATADLPRSTTSVSSRRVASCSEHLGWTPRQHVTTMNAHPTERYGTVYRLALYFVAVDFLFMDPMREVTNDLVRSHKYTNNYSATW